MKNDKDSGTLYVVATPIGNLGDMTSRAIEVLTSVDVIAAEDTRHTARLLSHFGLHKPMIALHEHNESGQASRLQELLTAGQNVALVSDAGTPLISDPGYRVVSLLRDEGFRVSPVPGACALIAALSAAGLPSDRFIFEGFLPARRSQRLALLGAVKKEVRTVLFYESPHRILESLGDMRDVYGGERKVVLARELTKAFETFFKGSLEDVLVFVEADDNQQRGEFVLIVAGYAEVPDERALKVELEIDNLILALSVDLPVKRLAALLSGLTGVSRNDLYQRALYLKQSAQKGDER
jgi:16S rRNA (cytidine1402-2'-O)-methyltransferase